MKTSRSSGQRGQELVEFAITFSVLFLLLMGILDLGRVTILQTTLFNAAREGARYGVIYPEDTTGIEGVVEGMAVGLDPATLTIEIEVFEPPPRSIQVRVSAPFSPVTPVVRPFLPSDPITIGSQATMRIEE